MSGILNKVKPGDKLRIPAATFNAFVDAAADFQRRQRSIGRDAQGGPSPAGQVLVRNDSGADADRFAILGIDDVLVSPGDNLAEFQRRPALSCVVPDGNEHVGGRWVILAEPLAAGALGRAWLFGMCVAQVDVQDDGHRFADIYSGESGYLRSATDGGALILWKAGGEGVVWAVVVLRGIADLSLLTVEDDVPGGGGTYAMPSLIWAETSEGERKLALLVGDGTYPTDPAAPPPLRHDESGGLVLAITPEAGLRATVDGLEVEPADFAGDGLDGTAWKLKIRTQGSIDLFGEEGSKAIDLVDNTNAPVAATISPGTTFDVDAYGRIILASIR